MNLFGFEMNTEHSITIPIDKIHLDGFLHIPHHVKGIVIFAHGSGSSRLSPRNQYIAKILQQAHFATLLFDLLTASEETIDIQTREFRFNIELLAKRLLAVTAWVSKQPNLAKLPIGYFGASTGGGAALWSAALARDRVKTVVSRGGRPDLADPHLEEVQAATLLIVGGEDKEVIKLNEYALKKMRCIKKLEIVPGATHLFEEPGKLEEVGRLAELWFERYLT